MNLDECFEYRIPPKSNRMLNPHVRMATMTPVVSSSRFEVVGRTVIQRAHAIQKAIDGRRALNKVVA